MDAGSQVKRARRAAPWWRNHQSGAASRHSVWTPVAFFS